MNTQKDLRKLTRQELLELLLEQGKELEKLRGELKDAKDELADRSIRIHETGSIAEAAMELSGIFEAAQKAADLYLDNIRQQYGESNQGRSRSYHDISDSRYASDNYRYSDGHYGDHDSYDDEDEEELGFYDE